MTHIRRIAPHLPKIPPKSNASASAARRRLALVPPRVTTLLAASLAVLAGCAAKDSAAEPGSAPLVQPQGMPLAATGRSAIPPLARPMGDAQLAGEFNNIQSNGAMYFAGWPTEAGMRALAARGVKRVIALKTPEETLQARGYDPQAVAKSLGIGLVVMPVNAETLSDAYIASFAREVDRDGGPTLVYCGSASTCGMVWGSYLAKERGLSAGEAMAQARAAGLKDGPQADAARKYIAGTAAAPARE